MRLLNDKIKLEFFQTNESYLQNLVNQMNKEQYFVALEPAVDLKRRSSFGQCVKPVNLSELIRDSVMRQANLQEDQQQQIYLGEMVNESDLKSYQLIKNSSNREIVIKSGGRSLRPPSSYYSSRGKQRELPSAGTVTRSTNFMSGNVSVKNTTSFGNQPESALYRSSKPRPQSAQPVKFKGHRKLVVSKKANESLQQ